VLSFAAVYNWRGDTRYGLPLEIGETVQILEECTGNVRDQVLSLSLSLSVFQLAEMQRLPIVRPRVHVAGMLPAVMKSSGNVVYYRIIAHPRSNRTGNDSNEGNEERKF